MKNIMPLNKKGQRHGYWEWYHTNGLVAYKGFYNNGKQVGYDEYHLFVNNEVLKTYYI